jgi:long-chain acyl-CoA synthetase
LKSLQKFNIIKLVIVMDQGGSYEEVAYPNIEIMSLTALEILGQSNVVPHDKPKPDDVYTICYTSGTTGLPKGVMLTHANMVADVASVLVRAEHGLLLDAMFSNNDVHFSYLPLAHMLERIVVATIITVGASIAFYSGNVMKLMDDITLAKPSFFVSVPRLLNRIHDKIIAQANERGIISQFIFKKALTAKRENLKHSIYTHWLWDRLIFNKIKQKLGGRVGAILSGAAPISGDTLDVLSVCFCCPATEGFGQTETAAGSTLGIPKDSLRYQVGVPLPCNEIKLTDIPEMNYFSKDKPYPRGEICLRGPNVFRGYYKDEVTTKEVLDADGWCHSGDVGMFDDEGRLFVIDRKKNIFKLAQGEYIAPEKIENVYIESPFISQCFVYGDSFQAFLIAIVVPDEEVVMKYAQQRYFPDSDSYEKLCKTTALKNLLMEDMNRVAKEKELKGFEKVRVIWIESVPFSIDSGLLTPTFKLKRAQAKQHYQKVIKTLYAEESTVDQ